MHNQEHHNLEAAIATFHRRCRLHHVAVCRHLSKTLAHLLPQSLDAIYPLPPHPSPLNPAQYVTSQLADPFHAYHLLEQQWELQSVLRPLTGPAPYPMPPAIPTPPPLTPTMAGTLPAPQQSLLLTQTTPDYRDHYQYLYPAMSSALPPSPQCSLTPRFR